MCHTHTWTISGPGLSVSVNSITIIMEVVYLEFTQNEYHHHHQDHHHGSHNQQSEGGYGISRPQDDLCIYIWISVMITTQATEKYSNSNVLLLQHHLLHQNCSKDTEKKDEDIYLLDKRISTEPQIHLLVQCATFE